MFEKFLSSNSADFRQRYEGSWGWFVDNTKKTKILSQIASISGDGHGSVLEFVDKNGISFSLRADAERDVGFEFLPTMTKAYNTPKGVYVVTRHPARQWKRGIHSSNTRIYLLNKSTTLNRVEVDGTCLGNIFDTPVTLEKAVENWNKGGDVLALNQFFVLHRPSGRLYLHTDVVGNFYITDKGIAITQKDDLWKSEIKDAFAHAGLSFTFEGAK